MWRLLLLPLVLLVSACDDDSSTTIPDPPSGSLLVAPLGPLPERLSQTGLYPRAPRLDAPTIARAYEPIWPLWSDGLDKTRHLVLPAGTTIDTSDPESWQFPVGTLLFKTFAREGHLIETRLLRHTGTGWEFAVYRWDDDQEDATFLDITRPTETAYDHVIPNRLQCRQCHESAPDPVLGIDRWQTDTTAHADLLSNPVSTKTVDQPNPAARVVIGYFLGNCVSCHNGRFGNSSSFDLRPDVALTNIIDVPTQTSGTASGLRVASGDPSQSILFLAVSGETDNPEVKLMPPVGVTHRDATFIEALRFWITSLEDTE